MDFLSLIILAGAVGCLIVIAFYIRSGRSRDDDTQEAIPEEENAALPMKEEGDGPGQTAKGYHALYIPPGMLGDERNADIRGQVEKAIRGFQWDEDGDGHAFLYTFTKEKSGWVCPYCEGENREEDPICMICGRSREQDEGVQEKPALEDPSQENSENEESLQAETEQAETERAEAEQAETERAKSAEAGTMQEKTEKEVFSPENSVSEETIQSEASLKETARE